MKAFGLTGVRKGAEAGCWLKGWKTKKVLAGAAGEEGAAGVEGAAGAEGAAVTGAAGLVAAVVAILTGWDWRGASVRVIRTGVGLWVGGCVGGWVGAGVGFCVGAGVGAILIGAGVGGGGFT